MAGRSGGHPVPQPVSVVRGSSAESAGLVCLMGCCFQQPPRLLHADVQLPGIAVQHANPEWETNMLSSAVVDCSRLLPHRACLLAAAADTIQQRCTNLLAVARSCVAQGSLGNSAAAGKW
jgi:hypothetical protein